MSKSRRRKWEERSKWPLEQQLKLRVYAGARALKELIDEWNRTNGR